MSHNDRIDVWAELIRMWHQVYSAEYRLGSGECQFFLPGWSDVHLSVIEALALQHPPHQDQTQCNPMLGSCSRTVVYFLLSPNCFSITLEVDSAGKLLGDGCMFHPSAPEPSQELLPLRVNLDIWQNRRHSWIIPHLACRKLILPGAATVKYPCPRKKLKMSSSISPRSLDFRGSPWGIWYV